MPALRRFGLLTLEPLRSTPAYIGPIMEKAVTFPVAIFPVQLGRLNTPSPFRRTKTRHARTFALRHGDTTSHLLRPVQHSAPPARDKAMHPYLAAPSIEPLCFVEIPAPVGGVGGKFPSSTPRCLCSCDPQSATITMVRTMIIFAPHPVTLLIEDGLKARSLLRLVPTTQLAQS